MDQVNAKHTVIFVLAACLIGMVTVIGREQVEESQLHQLSIALKQQLLKEMREEQNAGRTTQ